MSEAKLGDLEQLVLLAVLRLEESAYAVNVRDEIADRAGRSLTRGTIYVTLHRLEEKGLLESWFSDPTPERGGKAKKCFRLAPGALEALREARDVWRSMWAGTALAQEKS